MAAKAASGTRETPPKAERERKRKVTLTLSPRLINRLHATRGNTPLSAYVEDACKFFLAFMEIGAEKRAREIVAEEGEN